MKKRHPRSNGMHNGKKKGMAALQMLIAAVIAVMIIIILVILFKKISDGSEAEALRTRCKTSINAYSRLKNMPFGDAQADESKIFCPTQYITIEDGRQNDMRRQVANLMVECWDNYGKGKLRLFDTEDMKFCAICSVFQFEDRSVRLTGLPSFMMTERAPVYEDGRRPTYEEFITGHRTREDVVDTARNEADMNYLDGSKRYAVMFTYYKESYWSQFWRGAAGFVAGAVVVGGVIVGLAVAGVTLGTGTGVTILIISGSVAAGGAIAGGVGAATADESAGVTTAGAEWDANIITAEYSADHLQALGCESLPVSDMDERFR